MQPGGRRFDPGRLHPLASLVWRACPDASHSRLLVLTSLAAAAQPARTLKVVGVWGTPGANPGQLRGCTTPRTARATSILANSERACRQAHRPMAPTFRAGERQVLRRQAELAASLPPVDGSCRRQSGRIDRRCGGRCLGWNSPRPGLHAIGRERDTAAGRRRTSQRRLCRCRSQVRRPRHPDGAAQSGWRCCPRSLAGGRRWRAARAAAARALHEDPSGPSAGADHPVSFTKTP